MEADGLRRRAADARRTLASLAPMDVALRLTALDLLLRPVGGPRLRPLFLGVAALLLMAPRGSLARIAWAALTALAAIRVVADWPLADNHAYLLGYWCLAATLALGDADPADALARNGRLLVGLAFAFAVAWKALLSPDFLDGTFFEVTILSDPRLDAIARWASGLAPPDLQAWRDFVGGFAASAPGPVPPRLRVVAGFGAAWTVVLEGAVAIAFLGPDRARLARARDALLLLFCATTYAVLPVKGFGWLLLAMGAAQSPPERRGWRIAYVAAFGWIALWGLVATAAS